MRLSGREVKQIITIFVLIIVVDIIKFIFVRDVCVLIMACFKISQLVNGLFQLVKINNNCDYFLF